MSTGKELLKEDLLKRLAVAEEAFKTASQDIARNSAAVALWQEAGYQGELLEAMQGLRAAQITREEVGERVGRLQHALELLKDLALD